jgi:hypothetical protein
MEQGEKRSDDRREWKNTSAGYVSAVQVNRRGDTTAVSVDPGGTVWMNAEEEELTAKAPSDPAKNPFLPQPFEDRDPATGETVEKGERPIFVLADEERYVPPRGSTDDREETGTPGAKSPGAKAATRRRRPRKEPAKA